MEPTKKKIRNLTFYIYLDKEEEIIIEEEICQRFPSMIPLVNKVAIKRELGKEALKSYPVESFKKYVFSGLGFILSRCK